MTKRDGIRIGLLSGIAVACGLAIGLTSGKSYADDDFQPYTYIDENGQKIYVRRDCHPTLPEIGVDGRIADEDFSEVMEQDVEQENIDLAAMDDEGWELGTASAYGGYGDDEILNNQMTATMEAVNENSYGVAVPMCWNTRENLGKTILIRYNGKTVEGIINDVGGMGNGTRTLDLQPGIFHEFGAEDCNEWGLRTVEYKILD